jgi:hypothetical protein
VKNQQKELIAAVEAAPAKEKDSVVGEVLRQQGKRHEETSRSTLKQIPGAEVEPGPELAKGLGGELDNAVRKGGKTVYVESKLTIQDINDRTVKQLVNGVNKINEPGAKGISVFLDVARKPTAKELAELERRLGPEVFSKIKDNIVSSQTELFNRVKSALK